MSNISTDYEGCLCSVLEVSEMYDYEDDGWPRF